MNKLEITGELKHISEVEIIGTNSTEKRVFVIEIEPGQYSQDICFELFKEKVSLINNFAEGETITVNFDLRGREWNGKWYVNLSCWRIARSNDQEEVDPIESAIPVEPDLPH